MPAELAAALKRDLSAAYDQLPASMATGDKLAELTKPDRESQPVEADIASAWWAAIDAGMTLPVLPVSGGVLIGLSTDGPALVVRRRNVVAHVA